MDQHVHADTVSPVRVASAQMSPKLLEDRSGRLGMKDGELDDLVGCIRLFRGREHAEKKKWTGSDFAFAAAELVHRHSVPTGAFADNDGLSSPFLGGVIAAGQGDVGSSGNLHRFFDFVAGGRGMP